MAEPLKRWPTDAATREEWGRRADEVYDQYVKPKVTPEQEGKFVALDINTGAYEIGENELETIDRLEERYPQAAVWLTRVGYGYAHRFGWAFSLKLV